MILRRSSLTLEPEHPLRFSVHEFRLYLNRKLAEYTTVHRHDAAGFIHRYPVLQCKQIKGELKMIGINQGADCLYNLTQNQTILGFEENSCRITARDPEVMNVFFGITDTVVSYEFLIPWLALNQQHEKMFYDLNGKPARDTFLQKILTRQLTTLAKSLDCPIMIPVSCEAKVRFRRDRVGRENMMVFLGKFRSNLSIPDYLGIGRSVSHGFGTIKRITESPDSYSGES